MKMQKKYDHDTIVRCGSGDSCVAKNDPVRFPAAPNLPLKEFSAGGGGGGLINGVFMNQCRHCRNGGIVEYDVPPVGFFRCSFGDDCVTGNPLQPGEGHGYAPRNAKGNRECAACVEAKKKRRIEGQAALRANSVDTTIEDDKRLYVYAWLCLETFTWEYVGKGRGSRCLAHHNRPGMRATEKVIFTYFCGAGPRAEAFYTELEAAVFSALCMEHGGDKTLTNKIDLRNVTVRPAVYAKGLEIADSWADRAAALYRLEGCKVA